MPHKTVPLSVRVPEEDAAFIASLQIVGAATPSDKLRTIITEARERSEGLETYEGTRKSLGELLGPAILRLRKIERDASQHSEAIFHAAEWAQELLAFVVSSIPKDNGEPKELLLELEEGALERMFSLFDAILRMGITKRSKCYDPEAIWKRMDAIIEIADLSKTTRN